MKKNLLAVGLLVLVVTVLLENMLGTHIPKLLMGSFFEDKDLNVLETEIEKAWSKVVKRKKSKKIK